MAHINVGIFGDTDQTLAKKLAKAGTINDIAIYNHASSEGVFSYVCPNSDKLQPILQVVGMIDFPIVIFRALTKEFAEQMVAVDAARFEHGFIVADGVPEEQIKQVIKGSSLERFTLLGNDPNEIRQAVIRANVKRAEGDPWLPIDNYFEVKGVGTVALTIVQQGKVKKYDTLRVEPLGKEVMIKGMQSQDRDIVESESGMRLGVNLKGTDSEELKRGYVICKSAIVAKSVKIKFTKSKYSREELTKGASVFISCGLQVIAATLADTGSVLTLALERPLAYQAGEKCIISSTKQTLPRIIGFGIIE